VEIWVAYAAQTLRVVFGVPVSHRSNLLARRSTVSSKWEGGKAGTWEIETRDIGNLKQLSGLQCGILDGICSLEPHSCVLCVNQPPFKFAAKMWYTQFKVGKQAFEKFFERNGSMGGAQRGRRRPLRTM
jgi:hypothetical protein